MLWYAPFIAIPVLCLISFFMVLFLVQKPKQKEKKELKKFIKETKEILQKKGRWIYSIFVIGVISMFVIFGVIFYLSETLETQYTIKGAMKGFILAIPLTLLSLSSYLSGKIIGKNKKLMKWIGFSGMLLLTISMVITGVTENIYFMVGFLSLSGIGIGLALPCMDTLIIEGVEKDIRGTITSLYSSMRFIGVAFGPLVVSLLINKEHWLVFGMMAAIGLIGSLLVLLSVKPSNSNQTILRPKRQGTS